MQCVILAGGLGTRMQPWTRQLPKSLIPVAGRPFVEWQLEWLAGNGVRDVVLSLGHLGDMISDFVADGARWDLRVSYVSECDGLLGTGGALRLAADQGVLGDVSLVLYGDSYLPIEIEPVIQAFDGSACPALMTVWRNDGLHDRSNAAFDGNYVVSYDKSSQASSLQFIDYGLSVISTALVTAEIPSGQRHDLADLFAKLSAERRLGGFEVNSRFYEIGSEGGLGDLDDHLRRR